MVHHSRGVIRLGGSAELAEKIAEDYTEADIADQDMAMLGFVAKLTIEPATIIKDDVDTLRSNGFDNRAIHDIVQVTSYFAYVNRIADGLGIELESK